MNTEVKLLQSLKAFSPIEVTELGITTEVKPLQPLKTSSLRIVNVFGISI